MQDLFFAVKFVRQKQSKYYTEVTATTVMLLMLAHILDPLQNLRSSRKWDKGININTKNDNSDTIQYQEAFQKYVENEYCTKNRRLPVIEPESVPTNNILSSAMASRSGQSSHNPYNLSRDDEE